MSAVSVVIPARNAERYLAEAVGSIREGTVPADEIVIVDDGSTDGTAALAASLGEPVVCISQEPLGLAAACNAGVRAARGELIGFVDSDDLWTERKLERQLEAMAHGPSIDAVFGHVVEFASPELTEPERAEFVVHETPAPARLRGAMLARRELLERVGPFEESIRIGDFIDWQARAEDAGARILLLDDVVLKRRIHLWNMGREEAATARIEYVRVVRRIRERRQGAAR